MEVRPKDQATERPRETDLREHVHADQHPQLDVLECKYESLQDRDLLRSLSGTRLFLDPPDGKVSFDGTEHAGVVGVLGQKEGADCGNPNRRRTLTERPKSKHCQWWIGVGRAGETAD